MIYKYNINNTDIMLPVIKLCRYSYESLVDKYTILNKQYGIFF